MYYSQQKLSGHSGTLPLVFAVLPAGLEPIKAENPVLFLKRVQQEKLKSFVIPWIPGNQTKLNGGYHSGGANVSPVFPPTSMLLTQTPVRATWTEPHSPVATALQCTDPALACQVPANCSTANLTPRSRRARF